MSGLDESEDLLISDEEKAVALYLIAAVAIGVAAAAASLTILLWALPAEGQEAVPGRMEIALPIVLLISGAILFAVFGRWPDSVTSEAAVDLLAPPDTVWDAIALRGDYPGWKKIYTGIERLDGPGESYLLHYAEDSACRRCRLPRDPDRSRWSSRAEVLDAQRPAFYWLRSFPRRPATSRSSMDWILDAEDMIMHLAPMGEGGTRLTYRLIVARPRMWMAFLSWLGRPTKEHLRSLKAHVEGRPDETLFGFSAKRMAAARAAPNRCRCPQKQ